MNSKRWFIHSFNSTERKWYKVFRMCLTFNEASYNMQLLERGDKFKGVCNNYRIVCISIKPTTVKQLELAL